MSSDINFFFCCIIIAADNVKPKKPIDLPIPKSADEDLDDEDDDLEDEDDLDGDGDNDSENDNDDDDSEGDLEDVLSDQAYEDESDEAYLDDYDTTTAGNKPSTDASTTEKNKQDVTAMPPVPISTSTQQPSQPQGTPDPYLTHFDPRSEHQSYKQAQMRLEEVHKEKVTKVK